MKNLLDTTIGNKHLKVDFIVPTSASTQFDFIKIWVDGVEMDVSGGFSHGTELRQRNILCKQTCIALNDDLILSVAESKKLLTDFNLSLLSVFTGEQVDYTLDSGSWLSDAQVNRINVNSAIIQAMYFYFKRSATVNEAGNLLCRTDLQMTAQELKFVEEFFNYSSFLNEKSQHLKGVNGSVGLESEDVFASLKNAVIHINNHRHGEASAMDAKHPTLSPLFVDKGPTNAGQDYKDIPL